MMQDESTLLGLTNLRCHDQYTHNHSVNVSLLAMALGNRAGYPKVELADLGLSALFHDVGKCAISLDVLNKPGEFTQEEWAVMRSHPIEGVFTLVNSRGINNVPARMAAASFEHHMNYDYSGYPKLKVPWTQTVASRIITIADCYDAMTSSRVYRREPMSPANVLKERPVVRSDPAQALRQLRGDHPDRQSRPTRLRPSGRRHQAGAGQDQCRTPVGASDYG